MLDPPQICNHYRNSGKLDPVFRERVKSELEARGWSLNKLANESGVRYSVIYDWLGESGETKQGPTVATLEKIWKVLDLPLPPSKLAKKKGAK